MEFPVIADGRAAGIRKGCALLLCLATGTAAAAGPPVGPVQRPVARPAAGPGPASGPAEGWTLRGAANSSPVAVLDGPGNLQNLAIFCLSGEPFLALVFHKPPVRETLQLDFAFSTGALRVPARREPSAGDAYVLALRGQPLVKALAGKDSKVAVAIDAQPIGTLPLVGSSAAIRTALADCLPL